MNWIKGNWAVLLLGGLLLTAGWRYLEARDDYAAAKALAQSRQTALDSLRVHGDSLKAERLVQDSLKAVRDSARADSIAQWRAAASWWRDQGDSLAELLQDSIPPAMVPQFNRMLEAHEAEVQACQSTVLTTEAMLADCERRASGLVQELDVSEAARDSAMILVDYWREEASPDFLESLGKSVPGMLIGAVAGGLFVCIAAC